MRRRDGAVAAASVLVVGTAGWFALQDRTAPEPAHTPTPAPSASPTSAAPPVPVDRPGMPPMLQAPEGVLRQAGPGWFVASYAPESWDPVPADGEHRSLVLSAPTGELYHLSDTEDLVHVVRWHEPGAVRASTPSSRSRRSSWGNGSRRGPGDADARIARPGDPGPTHNPAGLPAVVAVTGTGREGEDHGGRTVSRAWAPVLDRLVQERYGGLVAYATVLTGERASAQDVVHDALVSTFGARASFASVPQAEAYVRRAIASRFYDRVRSSGRERAGLVRLAHATPESAELRSDLLDVDVAAALSRLSAQQRACVVLRHLDDLSVKDTASLLGISEGAVKRYVSDGVAALNALLGTTSSTSGESLPVTLVDRQEVRRDR